MAVVITERSLRVLSFFVEAGDEGRAALELKKHDPDSYYKNTHHTLKSRKLLRRTGSKSSAIYHITKAGKEALEHAKKNPGLVRRNIITSKRNQPPAPPPPEVYLDPIAQAHIETLSGPVAWASTLGTALRDISQTCATIIETENIPTGTTPLDLHNEELLGKIVAISEICKPLGEDHG